MAEVVYIVVMCASLNFEGLSLFKQFSFVYPW